MAVVEAYYRLHRATIYKDFGTPERQFCMRRNVFVRDNGQPCLIDFARARVDHECTIKGYSWLTTEYRFAPSFGCEELHTVVRETDAYETEHLGIELERGPDGPFHYVQDKSAEDMVDEMNYDSDELEGIGGREGLVERLAQAIKRHEENLAVRAEKLEKEGIAKHKDDQRHPDMLQRYLARQRDV
ncbi:hypothetical protein FOMPIDRAFT_101924 [Fomitopsis schrenkii]|uniref:Uncharacterized protein n=1 Tax=Fomitopsis schrenkii TaxID=2126942 RepID=S8EGC8_FOMSC|nr:hypothetical protein FOMPIDRAFT_101924 [Fomitopsis schrenkii]